MERAVLRYAPNYWDTNSTDNRQVQIGTYSSEFPIIQSQIRKATNIANLQIISVNRYQNVHDYGQFLVRAQLMAITKPYINYYRVRRYTTIKKHYLSIALEYNLDHRRCNKSNLMFQKHIDRPRSDEIIMAVQVITDNINASFIEPANNSEYFIEYIVEVQN